jgi:hypothetical protein
LRNVGFHIEHCTFGEENLYKSRILGRLRFGDERDESDGAFDAFDVKRILIWDTNKSSSSGILQLILPSHLLVVHEMDPEFSLPLQDSHHNTSPFQELDRRRSQSNKKSILH